MRPKIKPKKPYTKQQIANKIWQHFFVEQQPKSINKIGYCQYGRTGCAIGCLLTIKSANRCDNFRGSSTSIVDVYQLIKDYFFSNVNLQFLDKLQRWHDYGTFDWHKLIQIFKEYKINTSKFEKDLKNATGK